MRRRFLVIGIVLLGAVAVFLGLQVTGSIGHSTATPPVASPVPDGFSTFRGGFLPLVRNAVADAEILVAMGASRERNLFHIRAGQEAMTADLAAADDWLETHPPGAGDEPAVAAYREGAEAIRLAMQEAQAGFLHLDFARVARATASLGEGASALQRALALLDGPAPAR